MARSRGRAALAVTLSAATLFAASATIAGCNGGTGPLKKGTSATQTDAAQRTEYLNQLDAAQQKLAAAETRIPTHPRTPAARSYSITLLAAAITSLANDLTAIPPPPSVAEEHAKLVMIVRSYAAMLEQAAKTASPPDGGLRGRMLISATNSAASGFAATVAKIDTTLGGGT